MDWREEWRSNNSYWCTTLKTCLEKNNQITEHIRWTTKDHKGRNYLQMIYQDILGKITKLFPNEHTDDIINTYFNLDAKKPSLKNGRSTESSA